MGFSYESAADPTRVFVHHGPPGRCKISNYGRETAFPSFRGPAEYPGTCRPRRLRRLSRPAGAIAFAGDRARVYAELADGSWHLGSVAQFNSTDHEFAKQPFVPLLSAELLAGLACSWCRRSRSRGWPVPAGTTYCAAIRQVWREYAARRPRAIRWHRGAAAPRQRRRRPPPGPGCTSSRTTSIARAHRSSSWSMRATFAPRVRRGTGCHQRQRGSAARRVRRARRRDQRGG